MEQCQAVVSSRSPAADVVTGPFTRAQEKAIERLPFTIRRVLCEEDMRKAVQIRHAAYARHIPEFAQTLLLPEASDYEDDTVVLLAVSKLDGSALGSTRIQTNLHRPLSVEDSATLPAWLQGRRLAEVTRLGIGEGRIGRLVKIALIKACFDYCEDNAIEWAVVTGRTPIDRQYEQLLFVDVFEGGQPVPLRHVGNIAHRVMAFEIATGEQRWQAAGHPLLGFFRHVRHPDIDISEPHPLRASVAPTLRPMPAPAPVRFAELSMN